VAAEVVVFTAEVVEASTVVAMAAAITVAMAAAEAPTKVAAPTEACAERRHRDAVPPQQDVGPSRAGKPLMTRRRAGTRLDRATVQAWRGNRPEAPWLEDRALGPRLEDQRLEHQLEDRSVQRLHPTRPLPTVSGIPSVAPTVRVDRRRPRTHAPCRAQLSTAVAWDLATPVGAGASASVAVMVVLAGAAAVGALAGVGASAGVGDGIRSGIGHRTGITHGGRTMAILRPTFTRIRTTRIWTSRLQVGAAPGLCLANRLRQTVVDENRALSAAVRFRELSPKA
jgi:hypothetical protein